MFLQKFFWKLFLSLVFAIVVAATLLGGLLYQHLYNANLNNLKENLRKEAVMLSDMLAINPGLMNDPRRVASIVHTEDRITIMSTSGVVLADNWAERIGKEAIENHANRPEFQAALKNKPIYIRRVSRTVSTEMLYYAVPVQANGKTVYVLRLAFALSKFYQMMARVRNYVITAALLSILLSLPFAYVDSSSINKQIERLRVGARQVATGNLDQRVEVEGSIEFQDLASDFNEMASQLRQKIARIQQEHARIDTLLSKMVEGVLAIDLHGKAVFANTAFCSMVGVNPDKIEGKFFLEITRNNPLSDFITELLEASEVRSVESREIKFLGPQGEKDFSVQASRIRSERHEGLILLVFHDITRMKRIEQVRKDFVANVSHELRTPLTALKGSTEVLLDGVYQNPHECKKFLEIMDKQLQNIQNLVSDMLKLASVEDSRLPLRREEVDLSVLLADVVSLVEPLAKKKHQEFRVQLPEDRILLNIDPGQIADALLNVLDNAVKYTPEGGKIEFTVRLQADGLIFRIQDNGIGIAPDQLPRIFERFYRVDKSRSREVGGTGLGLAIVKHAVENHAGSIQVQSDPGRGSVFTIRLPLTALIGSSFPSVSEANG